MQQVLNFDFGSAPRRFEGLGLAAAKSAARGVVRLREGRTLGFRLTAVKRHEKQYGAPAEVFCVKSGDGHTLATCLTCNLLIIPIFEVPLRGSGLARRFN
jgi:hypothetical protein